MEFKEFLKLCLFPAVALGMLDIVVALIGVVMLTGWQISALWKSNLVMIFISSGVICGAYFLWYDMKSSHDIQRVKREAKSSALLGTAVSFVSTTLPELAKMLCTDFNDRNWAVLVAYIAVAVVLGTSAVYYRMVLEYIDKEKEKIKLERKRKKELGSNPRKQAAGQTPAA